MLRQLVLVFFGSGLGGVARYLVDRAGEPAELFPDPFALGLDRLPGGTLAVNVIGSFLVGLVVNLPPLALAPDTRLFLTVGLAGGFTTFSAFSLQTLLLLQSGELPLALAYIFLSVALCLAATAFGFIVAGWLY